MLAVRGYAPEGQKRRYEAHFISKLTDADGEQAETQHWIETARSCDYIDQSEADRLQEAAKKVGRMLGSMMSKPETFCRRSS